MYGYFRPRSSHFNRDEARLFSAYYCRTCYCLRLKGGQLVRFFTTFDMAVYAIILNMFQKKERPVRYRCERYLTRTMHKFDGDMTGQRLADMSIILFGEKIHDDYQDKNYLRGGSMNLIYKKAVEKARKREPEMALIARRMTDTIADMQNKGEELYAILGYYGKSIGELFSCIDTMDKEHIDAIGAIAMWTFYMDMLSDYDDDVSHESYNGLILSDCPTLRKRFEKDFMSLIEINRRMSSGVRSAVQAIADSSLEWSVLNKITNYALKSAAAFALMDPIGRDMLVISGRCTHTCQVCRSFLFA